MLSVRGFIPVYIIIQPKFSLYFKEKNLWTCSFNSKMDEEMERRSGR
jgi:hypothetical protein